VVGMRVDLHLPRQAVASLETLSIKKNFLGIAAAPPGYVQQIAGEPVSCDSSVCKRVPIKGLTFDGACLRMRDV
jgi:hypothetical protein